MIIVTNFFEEYLSRNEANDPVKENKDIVIGVSFFTERAQRWAVDRATMEVAAKEAGVQLKVKSADLNSALQAAQIQNFISEGIDVLIVIPTYSAEVATSIQKAHNAGIKIISYERLVADTDIDLGVLFDDEKIGELQGEYLTKAVPKGNYILISESIKYYGPKLFKKGAMKYIQPLVDKGDIKIVADEAIEIFEPRNAYVVVENALIKNNNNVQGILSPTDGTAGGAIVALTKYGLAGKVAVTGQDANISAVKRIIEGTQLMTVFKDSRDLAKEAIADAIKLAKGEKINTITKINNGKIDVPVIIIENIIAVDKNNIDKVLIESGYLKKEDIYKQ